MISLIKLLITAVMTGIIPVTGVIYVGATNWNGKLSILLVGLLSYVLLAFYYSWLAHRPTSLRDWLEH